MGSKILKEFSKIKEECYSSRRDENCKTGYFTTGKVKVHYTENGILKIVWHSDSTPANIGNGTLKKEIEEMVRNKIIKIKAEKEKSNQAFNKCIEFAKEHKLLSGNEIEINYTEPEQLKEQGYQNWVFWNEEKKCYTKLRGGVWNDDFKIDGYGTDLNTDTIENTEKRIIEEYGRLPEKELKKVVKYIADFENKTIDYVS